MFNKYREIYMLANLRLVLFQLKWLNFPLYCQLCEYWTYFVDGKRVVNL